jgi:hypothetical protein
MRTRTLFTAYAMCRDAMDGARERRHVKRLSGFGIAVAGDPDALEWQRRERLAAKIAKRVYNIKHCPICGFRDGHHQSTCRRNGR